MNLTCDNICYDAGELCVTSNELPEHADDLVPLDLNKHDYSEEQRTEQLMELTLSRTACHISS